MHLLIKIWIFTSLADLNKASAEKVKSRLYFLPVKCIVKCSYVYFVETGVLQFLPFIFPGVSWAVKIEDSSPVGQFLYIFSRTLLSTTFPLHFNSSQDKKTLLYFRKCFPYLLMTFPNIHGMHPVALFRIHFRSYEKEPLFKDSFIFFLHSAKWKSEQKPHYGAHAV